MTVRLAHVADALMPADAGRVAFARVKTAGARTLNDQPRGS